MATPENERELQKFAADLKKRQGNTSWPDLIRAGKDTEEALGKARPKPLIQRIVGWILGVCLMIGGSAILLSSEFRLLQVLFSMPFIALGAHTFWVACKSGPARKL